MENLAPNLPDLLNKLDSDSLAYRLASQFRDAREVDQVSDDLREQLDELVERERGRLQDAN